MSFFSDILAGLAVVALALCCAIASFYLAQKVFPPGPDAKTPDYKGENSSEQNF